MVSPPASSGRVPAAGASSPSPGPAALQQPWLEGQLLVLPSPLPLHVHCPVAGCPRSYANQVQTAVRHSLLRHLRTDFHPGTSVTGSEWRSFKQECHWCRKWFTTRRGVLNHRARCPRRPPPAPPQPTDWAAALARLRAETAPAAGAPARPATPTSPELDLSLSPPPPPPETSPSPDSSSKTVQSSPLHEDLPACDGGPVDALSPHRAERLQLVGLDINCWQRAGRVSGPGGAPPPLPSQAPSGAPPLGPRGA
ncbi:predicted GPI-anchored protein 58 [Amphibalanus amphitrite]|uniref:predicted GPI-anchored protein 58 n=1 Tax=Amphibalanus amphitrite TaxID=1232801 RepID=UPI001C928AE9|nr:predicted GPI-anchored protein 58 [Amphibalanus amphitrite]